MFRQLFLLLLISAFLGCATSTSKSQRRGPGSVEDGMDTVTLESLSPRKLSSANCDISLPESFYFDPTFLPNHSKFDLLDDNNRKFGEMERQGTEQSSKFLIKNIHNGRVLGTAISNGRSPMTAVFDCDNLIFGSLRESFKKGKVEYLAANSKKMVQFVSEASDPLATQWIFKTTDGKEVFQMVRLSEHGREKWKVQIKNLGSIDPKFILFLLSYKSYSDDRRHSD